MNPKDINEWVMTGMGPLMLVFLAAVVPITAGCLFRTAYKEFRK